MTAQNERSDTRRDRAPGTPGAVSRWMQRTMNGRMNRKVRRGRGEFMGMDVLILRTVGRRSGQPRETPLAWFADGDDRLVVASGGGSKNPGWHANLLANPDRERAWQRIATAQPRIAKYQSKSEREYPVVRLTTR